MNTGSWGLNSYLAYVASSRVSSRSKFSVSGGKTSSFSAAGSCGPYGSNWSFLGEGERFWVKFWK